MAKFIEARVIQKVDTEANWLVNPLPLYQGEIALVRSGDRVVNMKVGNGTSKFSELNYVYNGGFNGSINPSTVTTELQNGFYFTEVSGTYNNAGGIVVKDGYYTILEKYSGGWKKSTEVKMPMQDLTPLENRTKALEDRIDPNGLLQENDLTAISGDYMSNYILGVNKNVDYKFFDNFNLNFYKTKTCRHYSSLKWVKYNSLKKILSLAIYRDGNESNGITIVLNGVSTKKNFNVIQGVFTYKIDDFDITVDSSFFSQKSNNFSDCYLLLPLMSNEFISNLNFVSYLQKNYGIDFTPSFCNNFSSPFFQDDVKIHQISDRINIMNRNQNSYLDFNYIEDKRCLSLSGGLYSSVIQILEANKYNGKYIYVGFYYNSTDSFDFSIKPFKTNYHHDGASLLRVILPKKDNLTYMYQCVKIDKLNNDNMLSILISPIAGVSVNITGLKILILDEDISSIVRPTSVNDIIKPLDNKNNFSLKSIRVNQLILNTSGDISDIENGIWFNGNDIIVKLNGKKYTLNKTEIQ